MKQMDTRKWQVLAFVGLSVSLFFSLRYVAGYFDNPVARELIVVSITTFILIVASGVAIVSTVAPKVLEYRTRPKSK